MQKLGIDGKSDSVKEFDFTLHDFERVRVLIYQRAGISLAESKHEMVYSRLARRLRATGMNSFSQYLQELERTVQGDEWEAFINALTTNLTSFFREEHHFPLLAEHAKKLKDPISVWCSASSTAERSKKFFLRGKGAQEGLVRVRSELRDLIDFKPLNLLADTWPISGTFDVIFCRNVMIYFDKPTQSKILQRFAPLLKPNGLLFAGHSENFAYVTNAFKLRGKTVYELSDHRSDK